MSFVRESYLIQTPPPLLRVGVPGWLRENLFSSAGNTLLTLTGLYLLWIIVPPFIEWALLDAVWQGSGRDACLVEDAGACWAFVAAKFGQFLYGRYTIEERWRADLVFLIGALTAGLLMSGRVPGRRYVFVFAVLIYPVLGYVLLTGGVFGLPAVETSLWGGLLLTFVVASVGMAVSFPLGILLALGRRSQMPVMRLLSILYIEAWRGVPLITVLFMASVMLPLFLPPGTNFDKLLRVLIGVALFSSAYMAEVVRGGLQAIARGQYEAASALGLGFWRLNLLIIMPQALRLVIPGIVNTFIGLFKDTTLVMIVGLFDFLGSVQVNFSDANWAAPQTAASGYVFAALVFWIICFSMSRYSMRIESRLNEGTRRT
ncbi:MAG: amino acid ABC transporter permease [Alphaproteobacteria bacterium]